MNALPGFAAYTIVEYLHPHDILNVALINHEFYEIACVPLNEDNRWDSDMDALTKVMAFIDNDYRLVFHRISYANSYVNGGIDSFGLCRSGDDYEYAGDWTVNGNVITRDDYTVSVINPVFIKYGSK